MRQLHGRGALVDDQATHGAGCTRETGRDRRKVCLTFLIWNQNFVAKPMHPAPLMLSHWALRLIHVIYAVAVSILTEIRRFKWKEPLPLTAHRSKVPAHLCLNLVASDELDAEDVEVAFLECLRRTVGWCKVVGIEALTVYDRDGMYHLERLVTAPDTVHISRYPSLASREYS